MTKSMMVNGKPVETVIACNAESASAPPTNNRVIATSPSNEHQKMRCATGASTLPPAVMVSMTSDPESEEVTKNTSTRMMPTIDSKPLNGKSFTISNSLISCAAAATGAAASAITWDIAVPPKVAIQKMLNAVGISASP